MLSKKNKLSLRKNPFLFKNNTKRYETPTLSFLWNEKILKEDIVVKNFRAAVLLGKKVSKKAVVRNKIKRQIYQVLQENLLDKNPGINLLIIPKQIVLKSSKEELKGEIIKTIQWLISNFKLKID